MTNQTNSKNKDFNLTKQLELINSNDKSVSEIIQCFKNAGIEIQTRDGVKAIINFKSFKDEMTRTLNFFDNNLPAIKDSITDDAQRALIVTLLKNVEKIKAQYQTLYEFMLNPPSREFLALQNNTLAINEILDKFSQIPEKLKRTNYSEMLEQFETFFDKKEKEFKTKQDELEKRIEGYSTTYQKIADENDKRLKNFSTMLDTKLNAIGEKYKNFSEILVNHLKNQRDAFDSDLKSYKEIKSKQTKNFDEILLNFKKEVLRLITILIICAVALGGVIGFGIAKIWLFH